MAADSPTGPGVMPAGTAGLKRHINITMEFSSPLGLSRLCLTSLVMVVKVSFAMEFASRLCLTSLIIPGL